MQLDFMDTLLNAAPTLSVVSKNRVIVGERELPIQMVRNRRAKRYIMRLLPELVLRVTIPRGGTKKEALQFVSENILWIENRFGDNSDLFANQPPVPWSHGTKILFRGTENHLRVSQFLGRWLIEFADQVITSEELPTDLRPLVEQHLRLLAETELFTRTLHLAGKFGFQVSKVSIRNQKSRWGSCSSNAAISLNWRLVQTPDHIRDYVILHELVHLKEMNHTSRYWTRLESLMMNYRDAEEWLKNEGRKLLP